MKNELLYQIALSLIPGIGGVLARNLLAYIGSAEGIFIESEKKLVKVPGIGEVNARRIRNSGALKDAEKELEFVAKHGISTLFITEAGFPRRLLACPDSPVLLYLKGPVNLNAGKIISIVGTRNATEYGREICEKLVADIAGKGYQVVVVSGLAYGIDVQAHRSALKYGLPTVGVLGHGLDQIYPSLHADTARKMVEAGALVTDFPSGTRIDPPNFLRRNRIIAGLADATIIVESGEKGGALVTADIASSYNRDVFAFPGRAGDTYSKGCNRLIRDNGAALIEGLGDLEYFLGWDQDTKNREAVQQQLFVELEGEEKSLYDLLKKSQPLFIDEISSASGLPVSRVSALLLGLEFKGVVSALPGKMYRLK